MHCYPSSFPHNLSHNWSNHNFCLPTWYGNIFSNMLYLAEIKKKSVLFRDNQLLKSSKSLVTGSQVSNTNSKRNEIVIIQQLRALMIHLPVRRNLVYFRKHLPLLPLLHFLLNVTPSHSPSRSRMTSSLRFHSCQQNNLSS